MKAIDKRKNRTVTDGFTLIELLVVIAIIAILASILLPVLERAKRHAYQVNCVSNLKQDGTAITMFADDNSDILPPGQAGINSNSGLSVGQVCSYYYGMPNVNQYLPYYLYNYLGTPAPPTSAPHFGTAPVYLMKTMFCPANEHYDSIALASNDVNVVSYQCVEGSTTAGRGYCGLQADPFGYNDTTSGTEPPLTVFQVSRQGIGGLAGTWELVDCDHMANGGIGGIVPPTPAYVHGNIRNYLWFDGHVSDYTIHTKNPDTASPYPTPYYGINP